MHFNRFLISFLYNFWDIQQCISSEHQSIEINKSGTRLLSLEDPPKIPLQPLKDAFKEPSAAGKVDNNIIRQTNRSEKEVNEEVVAKRNHVREVMKHAWDVYVKYFQFGRQIRDTVNLIRHHQDIITLPFSFQDYQFY